MNDQATKPEAVRYAPRRLGHINLFIGELARSLDFYTKVCGLEITALEPQIGAGFLSNGNTHHDIGMVEVKDYAERARKRTGEPQDKGYQPGLNHFGWEMENEAELVAAHFRAVAAGITPRITDQGTSRSNYIYDDDGTLHQFYADQIKDWRTVFTGGQTELHANPPWVPGAEEPSTDARYDPDPEIRRVSDAPLHPIRVTHGVLVSPDFANSLRFYTETAGFRPVHTAQGASFAYLSGVASAYDIILFAAGGDREPGFHRIAFEVDGADDLGVAAVDLRALGVEVIREYDTAHKRSLVIADPDGTKLEFFIRRDGSFAAVAAAAGEEQLLLA